jgi:prephenate dehydratase
MERVGYLGPKGTFTHEAALMYIQKRCRELVEYTSIPELIYGMDAREVDRAVVPMENTLEGTVSITIDMLIHEVDVKICGEMILPVHHCLLAQPGVDIEDLDTILSHPQALAQCRKFIHNNFKAIEVRTTASTAAAAKQVMQGCRRWGAIASRHAADIFNLEILRKNIEEHYGNSTRFVILSKEAKGPTGADKTSIVFTVDDQPGSLYHALKVFADKQINLTKIESRPMKTLLGQYLFLVDFEGHAQDDIIKDVLEKLSRDSKYFTVLGSYPKCSFAVSHRQES